MLLWYLVSVAGFADIAVDDEVDDEVNVEVNVEVDAVDYVDSDDVDAVVDSLVADEKVLLSAFCLLKTQLFLLQVIQLD